MVNSFSWAGSWATTQLSREANNIARTKGRRSSIQLPPTDFFKLCLRHSISELLDKEEVSGAQPERPTEAFGICHSADRVRSHTTQRASAVISKAQRSGTHTAG